jgi:hypothetical protein
VCEGYRQQLRLRCRAQRHQFGCRASTFYLCSFLGGLLCISFFHSLDYYEWNKRDDYSSDRYIEDLFYLGLHVLCWPRIPELREDGKKFEKIKMFDTIAANVTKTIRPKTKLLNGKDMVPPGWLVKREYSDDRRHVIFPDDKRKAARRVRDSKYRWMAQEVVPLITKLGEIRVVFVDREILYAVLTTPALEVWEWSVYNRPYSLKTLR